MSPGDGEHIILVRYGEIALKGQNRGVFERRLVSNIRNALPENLRADVSREQGRIFVTLRGDLDDALSRLRRIFGIVSVSPVMQTPLHEEAMAEAALEVAHKAKASHTSREPFTFKIDARRSNKDFHKTSPEINQWLGAHVLRNLDDISVDVHSPILRLQVEVRTDRALFTGTTIRGPGGLPVGTSGRGLLLLSGGIDSPVAGWYMMKRGMKVEAVHFHTPPFTGPRAQRKVEDLASLLAPYNQGLNLHLYRFTDTQEAINARCPSRITLTVMRRAMLRLAGELAGEREIPALITGESLGQVASQTLENMAATDEAVRMPILRPLVGLDKEEIIDRAREIGTYETSILPHEDCCSLFVPKHPKTRPSLEEVVSAEASLDLPEERGEIITRSYDAHGNPR